MTEQEIKDLLSNGERVTLECKRAMSAVPNSVWETYSAFANTYGGVILLGVHENLAEKDVTKRFTITGVEDADKIRKDLWNMLNNPEKVSVNLLKDEDVDEITIDGKTVIYVNVPRASLDVRPVYINGNPLRGAFKRNHEGDYHMSQSELRMMLRDADNESNDKLLIEHYTLDDIDPTTLSQYRLMFRTDHPDHVWNKLEDKDFLKQMGGYAVDREKGTEGLTLCGLLMFGKGLSIRERFSNLRMDYIDKSHLIGDQRYSDRLTYDGTWENNLFNFMQTVLPKLTKELPRPFQMEGVIRKDDTPQHKAVREAFTNMVIHADLQLEGLLRVVKYDNRFEFTNPGLLKLPIERIYAGDESKARNQNMQNMLRMIGFGEGIGSGFPLILSASEEKHWARPELIEEQDLMQVKLVIYIDTEEKNVTNDVTDNVTKENKNVLKNVINENADVQHNTSSENTDDVLKESGNVLKDVIKNPGHVIKDVIKELTERQKIIVKILIGEPTCTVDDLSDRLGVTWRTIMRDIEKLKKLNVVIREGGRAEGRWIVKIDKE